MYTYDIVYDHIIYDIIYDIVYDVVRNIRCRRFTYDVVRGLLFVTFVQDRHINQPKKNWLRQEKYIERHPHVRNPILQKLLSA